MPHQTFDLYLKERGRSFKPEMEEFFKLSKSVLLLSMNVLCESDVPLQRAVTLLQSVLMGAEMMLDLCQGPHPIELCVKYILKLSVQSFFKK